MDSAQYQMMSRHIQKQASYQTPPTENDTLDIPIDCNAAAGLSQDDRPFGRPGAVQGSLELRRLPTNILLLPEAEAASDLDDSVAGDDRDDGKTKSDARLRRGLLRRTCLNAKYSLRSQLMLSFGTISTLTIALVIVVCTIVALNAKSSIESVNEDSFSSLLTHVKATTGRLLSESLTPRLIPVDLVNILYEATRDRFEGYPDESDDYVPFFDILSRTNKYPVVGRPLPLDWQIDANVNNQNSYEHVQDRWPLYRDDVSLLSTTDAFYGMRGSCDPLENNSSAFSFWPNCTAANNNITTGGVDAPSPMNAAIYRKASDLAPLLKALYEYHQDVYDIGIYFANEGAGSFISYPHYPLNTHLQYTSIGCDWMKSANPYSDSFPIGYTGQIKHCRTNGTSVSSRVFNPLEQAWCRNQALNPGTVTVFGPFQHPFRQNLWVMSVGRPVYDRFTNNFVGCIHVGFTVSFLREILNESRFLSSTQLSVIRWDDRGTVVASTASDDVALFSHVTIDQLNVGLDEASYENLRDLVNYDAPWITEDAREKYDSFFQRQDGFIVTANPMPPVPNEYDALYRPEFFVLVSVSEAEYTTLIAEVNNPVDESVNRILRIASYAAVGGLIALLVIIAAMSEALTAPLKRMNKAADEIVKSFGDTSNEDKRIQHGALQYESWNIPRTELSLVTEEFEKMVSSFSGSSMARSMKKRPREIENQFLMQKEWDDLYKSRRKPGFLYEASSQNSEFETGEALTTSSTRFLHFGPNVTPETKLGGSVATSASENVRILRHGFASPLFVWILLSIVFPLLITTVTISIIVLYEVSNGLINDVDAAKASFLQFEQSKLTLYATNRAELTSVVTSRSVRDLHVLTRYSSWLLFGAMNRSQTFTEMISGVEECKNVSDISTCSYFRKYDVCACDWNDTTSMNGTCKFYSPNPRFLQKLFFACQSQDTWSDGDRNSTSFPNVSSSPATTAWWSDVMKVPGFEAGPNATGYDTTYDRFRFASSLPIFQVLYNYDTDKVNALASYVALEGDGAFFGYRGCRTGETPFYSRWVSSTSDAAYLFRPELCPLGKYGYDPRCCDWYSTGRDFAIQGKGVLHITPPYDLVRNVFAQSATAPLMDPASRKYVGQTLIDFKFDSVYDSLSNEHISLSEGGFPVLITTQPNPLAADTLVGPGLTEPGTSLPIMELVIPHDLNGTSKVCMETRSQFQRILDSMKQGENATASFVRSTEGGTREIIYISFAPVVVKAYAQLDSSDFSRGVEPEDYLVYSLAVAETERGLLGPFQQIEDNTRKHVDLAIIILSVLLFVATLVVIYISYLVALSITKPMVFLLELMRSINRMEVGGECPQVDRSVGSREIVNFTDSMETLYMVIRSANAAYFSGNLEKAYVVLVEALKLFKRLDNKKAISVASNNLGNIMLNMYRMLKGQESLCGLTKRQMIKKGTAYFHDAISIGERAYEDFYESEGWTPRCLDFMQHLSNRYFNRAMFLLSVKGGHEQPEELEKLGLRDLQISHDMDVEIIEQGEEVGWGATNRVQDVFEVTLVRGNGHIVLLEMGYPDDWGTAALLDSAFKLIQGEMKKGGSSVLFRDIGPVGRMQQIESLLMRYKMLKDEVETAARVAIRMLVEDECVLADSQKTALKVLAAYVEYIADLDDEARKEMKSLLLQDHRHADVLDRPERSDDDHLELVAFRHSAKLIQMSSSTSQFFVNEYSQGDLIMEMF